MFVIGSTGFIGTQVVKELVDAGHSVRGLTRTDAGLKQLHAAGAEAFRGDIRDMESLRSGAEGMDAVINLAFDHDMAKFAGHASNEVKAIETLGAALEPGKVLLVTSGVAIAAAAPGEVRKEIDAAVGSPEIPRKGEQAARAVAANGVNVGVLRMSQIHDTAKQGLVSYLVNIARTQGLSAYVGEGAYRWAAAPVADVAYLYRLAVEQTGPGLTTYHAVQEEAITLRAVAQAIGAALGVPVRSIPEAEAQKHVGLFAHFAMLDTPASSAWTRKKLGWNPGGPSLIEDLGKMKPE